MEENKTINQEQKNGKELVRDEEGKVISGVLNPTGRPKKGHSITETIKSMFDKEPEIKKELAKKILDMAKAGDIQAIKTLWNYIDGMPKQTIKVEGDDDSELAKQKLKEMNDKLSKRKLVGNS